MFLQIDGTSVQKTTEGFEDRPESHRLDCAGLILKNLNFDALQIPSWTLRIPKMNVEESTIFNILSSVLSIC